MKHELWDAYDRDGKPLGFDLVRGEPFPEGAWHLVADIFSVTKDGRVLLTRRHPEKSWGGYWEYTGGSVLKGETPLQGALRELREETGITADELHPVYVEARTVID
ncbi:MAG: NUDIX domain-containing protein [Oscillospiraceae bacterium]|nr:NUDIX domain-containing protein [Oscillospiraceae bacterium]